MSQSLRYRWLGFAARAGIVALVLFGIGHAIRRAAFELQTSQDALAQRVQDLRTRQETNLNQSEKNEIRDELDLLESQIVSIWNVRPLPVVLALVCSVVGLLPAGWYWFQVLKNFKQDVHWLPMQEAYFLGHLGKYLPGKAMVFVLRLGRLRAMHVPLGIGTASIFVETLTVMAVGAAVGGVMLLFMNPPPWLFIGAWLGVLAATIPTVPGLFANVIRLVARNRIGSTAEAVSQGLTWGLFVRGWIALAMGWLVMGLSAWLVIYGVVPSSGGDRLISTSAYAACTAAASLSIVAGFVSFLPGGAGVRELVIILILGPMVGNAPAIFAAIILRLVSLASEMLLFTGLNLILRLSSKSTKVQPMA